MDIIHVKLVFKDQFSGCTDTKYRTVSVATFEKMKRSIGNTFTTFDQAQAIRYHWKVLQVEQTTDNAIIGS
jgi:hypothetical protein